ncbi:carbohydrate porin [Roseomonas sp. HJA6]|uniref:Carbohydrate porin n=1 Tax=Roseomonas alba TaxID=2846776 RepID=A0ABS7AG39_9PROT|nr:carbohydrate porin [Neoroseomonas alba]MBW6401271.1 carbohydrate porin [Neoroseomonas alba]
MPTPRPYLAVLILMLASAALPAAADEEDQQACDGGHALADGLCFSAVGTLDAVQNLRGGIRSGPAAIGLLNLGLEADLERLMGLEGWSATMSVYGIYGRQPTPTRVGSLAAVSNIEAVSTVRLNELWVQRSFGEWGSIRAGQLAADAEFITAFSAGNLVNGTFGWPVSLANTLPGGGPAYPLPTLGARIALGDPDGGTGIRAALFSGNPGGKYGVDTNPQMHNRYGTTFSTADGIFYIAEAVTGGEAPGGDDAPRSWVLKLGGWFYNGGTDSVLFDETGLSLADPASNGVPQRFRNNYGGYGVGEVTLWRGDEGWLSVFGRVFTQPDDRNAVALQLDGGLAWRGPFGRSDDTFSVGVSWARIGNQSRSYDRDVNEYGTVWPIRSAETVLEINYDFAAIKDRLSIRPLVQFYFNPAAGEPNEQRSPDSSLPDAVVIGLRLVATL